jgi:membrane fusion protein, heavy metal efflux system
MNNNKKRTLKNLSLLAGFIMCLGLWSCDSVKKIIEPIHESIFSKWLQAGNPSKKSKSTKKAPVKISIKEGSLVEISLSDKARERLGIQTATIERRTIQKTRSLGGEIMVPPGKSFTISAPLSGVVLDPEGLKIPSVGAGLLREVIVLRLLILPPEKDLLTAKDNLKVAQNQFSLAKQKAERATQLLKEGAGSARAHEEALSGLEDSKTGLRLAKAMVNLLDNRDFSASAKEFAPLEVGAPIDGILKNLHVAPGQRVSAGSPLFEMAAQSNLWVRVPIYAGLATKIDSDQMVVVHNLSDGSQSKGIRAHPVLAPPSGNPLAASVDLYFELPPRKNAFQPGEKVTVSLKLKNKEKGLTVPRSAVLYDIHGGTWVYINTDANEFVRSRIEIQTIANNWAVLSRGPVEGTSIVTSGTAELFGTEFGSGK